MGEQATRVHKQTLSTFANIALTPAIELSQAVTSSNSPPTSAWAERPELAPFTELTSVCLRLQDPLTITARSTLPDIYPPGTPVNHYSLLLETLSNTIAATEIAHRGREAEVGTSLLSAIPQQTLSHLQILSSTVRSYSATCAVTVRETIDEQYREVYQTLFRQMFGQYEDRDFSQPNAMERDSLPLLLVDSFSFLTEASMVLCPLKDIELRHILRIALSAELLRVCLKYSFSPSAFLELVSTSQAAQIAPLSSIESRALEQPLSLFEDCFVSSYSIPLEVRDLFESFKDSISGYAAAHYLRYSGPMRWRSCEKLLCYFMSPTVSTYPQLQVQKPVCLNLTASCISCKCLPLPKSLQISPSSLQLKMCGAWLLLGSRTGINTATSISDFPTIADLAGK